MMGLHNCWKFYSKQLPSSISAVSYPASMYHDGKSMSLMSEKNSNIPVGIPLYYFDLLLLVKLGIYFDIFKVDKCFLFIFLWSIGYPHSLFLLIIIFPHFIFEWGCLSIMYFRKKAYCSWTNTKICSNIHEASGIRIRGKKIDRLAVNELGHRISKINLRNIQQSPDPYKFTDQVLSHPTLC